MGRVRYERAPEVCRAVEVLVTALGLDYVDVSRVYCVRSRGSRSRAYARIYGTPGAWAAALGYNPGYVIEVVSERFDPLPLEEKVKVVIHEILHIPRTFSGGLRAHGPLVNGRRVAVLYRRVRSSPGVMDILREALDGRPRE
ncbi:putative metallopeptidase [Aeropyrum camini]|uniref:Predicted metallopeptidase n=1 Tax=Aeropyrum camini SY1 = JCM 12091 TaxID=1198449 RepID=U3TA89_9CREN|nr:putative metallopeptidase [Aeropyrum camini]BAN90447.1 predicted metallopeptidase [Aeropyrum camini SY1 = JCM 12091]